MRLSLSAALWILLCAGILPAQGDKPSVNNYVKYSAALQGKKLGAGSPARLVITLKPARGIHINGTPPLSVTIDSTGPVVAAGKPDVPLVKATGFLDTKKPIVMPLTVSNDVKPGTVTVRGTLVYYYCSDAEGWCSRFKQPIEIRTKVGN